MSLHQPIGPARWHATGAVGYVAIWGGFSLANGQMIFQGLMATDYGRFANRDIRYRGTLSIMVGELIPMFCVIFLGAFIGATIIGHLHGSNPQLRAEDPGFVFTYVMGVVGVIFAVITQIRIRDEPLLGVHRTVQWIRRRRQVPSRSAVVDVPRLEVAGAHAGLSVGPDDATHQAMEDLAMVRVLPNMVVLAPCDYEETKKATIAAVAYEGPVYIRFARDETPVVTTYGTPFEIGRALQLRSGNDVTLIACGTLVVEALRAAELLSSRGIDARVLNSPTPECQITSVSRVPRRTFSVAGASPEKKLPTASKECSSRAPRGIWSSIAAVETFLPIVTGPSTSARRFSKSLSAARRAPCPSLTPDSLQLPLRPSRHHRRDGERAATRRSDTATGCSRHLPRLPQLVRWNRAVEDAR